MTDATQNIPPVEIPLTKLNPDTLIAIIESFVQREGTDYGVVEISQEAKVKQIHRQLEKGDAVVVFDPNTETVHIMEKNAFRKLRSL